jgi:hypothetical protein
MSAYPFRLDDEKARPRGDTGAGDGGDVRSDVQGISNREGDVNDPHDEVNDPGDDADEEENDTSFGR